MIYIKKTLSKVLISIILILLCLIYNNYNQNFKNNFDKYYRNNNLKFNKGLKLYQKVIGKPIFLKEEGLSSQVINLKNNYQMEDYLEGKLLNYENNSLVNAFNSGIVVFSGNKDNFGNTIIIQGIDGVDIWYGNIEDTSVALYDYVEKNKIIGKPINNKIYLKIEKEGKNLNITNYLNEIED